MKPTTRAARRGLAALALTAAAVAIPTTALAASGSPAKPAAAARAAAAAIPPRCGTAALTAWLGIPGDGYAGGVGYQLELSNTSNHTCSLYGFPGVSALAPGGHQLGRAANRGHAVAQSPGDAGPGGHRPCRAPDHRRDRLPAVVVRQDHRGGVAGLPAGCHQVAGDSPHVPGVRQERAGLPARGDHRGRHRHPRVQPLTPMAAGRPGDHPLAGGQLRPAGGRDEMVTEANDGRVGFLVAGLIVLSD